MSKRIAPFIVNPYKVKKAEYDIQPVVVSNVTDVVTDNIRENPYLVARKRPVERQDDAVRARKRHKDNESYQESLRSNSTFITYAAMRGGGCTLHPIVKGRRHDSEKIADMVERLLKNKYGKASSKSTIFNKQYGANVVDYQLKFGQSYGEAKSIFHETWATIIKVMTGGSTSQGRLNIRSSSGQLNRLKENAGVYHLAWAERERLKSGRFSTNGYILHVCEIKADFCRYAN